MVPLAIKQTFCWLVCQYFGWIKEVFKSLKEGSNAISCMLSYLHCYRVACMLKSFKKIFGCRTEYFCAKYTPSGVKLLSKFR